MDLHVEVAPSGIRRPCRRVEQREQRSDPAARAGSPRRAGHPYKGTGVTCNARLPSAMLRRVCRLAPDADRVLRGAFERVGLARAYDRVLKVSRTIADLAGSGRIEAEHVREAVQYRNLDRKYWYTA
ncbi:MAG: ATP-binding protein [Ruthenibacterium lactatiformans]